MREKFARQIEVTASICFIVADCDHGKVSKNSARDVFKDFRILLSNPAVNLTFKQIEQIA